MMPAGPRAAQRTATPTGSHGSMTVTTTPAEPSNNPLLNLPSGTLRLRAEPVESRRIQWADDVVDNEGMGRKSSKVCCIYHKPREAGESSSDESSSDSSSDDNSGSEPDTSRAQPANRGMRRHRHHNHDHDHNEDSDHGHAEPGNGDGDRPRDKGKGRARKPSPNAYERIPKRKEAAK